NWFIHLNREKAVGEDEIQPGFFAKCNMEILEWKLGFLISVCIKKTFPTRWKKVIIFPIHKDDNKYKPENYRPICLIDCIAKVFTDLLLQHLGKLMEENKLFNDFQFGFRKERETIVPI